MNFVFIDGAIYMHSHPFGEKLQNIKNNPNVGFEVDKHICFLPSYYFHPTDASQADTLYISVVIKGLAQIISNSAEKAKALNGLMKKYQKEGGYEHVRPSDHSVEEVSIIKVVPNEMRGKYKIGQHWPGPYRVKMARNILKREGLHEGKSILDIMRIRIKTDGSLEILEEPVL
jgi:nitroimidazol reductase NimA-like FMN-containing flavoprotein (pyridoxamine 5'-phosphate oxidase superfamily)